MIFQVELVGDDQIREVEVVDEKLVGTSIDLERIFCAGQNEIQKQQLRSVTLGDVIRYQGKRYAIELKGFSLCDD